MTHNDENTWLAQFWQQGAFLRISPEKLLLWRGPFIEETFTDAHQLESEFSVAYMNFFGTKISKLNTVHKPIEIKISELPQFLEQDQGDFPEPGLQRMDFAFSRQGDFETSLQTIQGKIQRAEIEKAVPIIFAGTEKKPNRSDLKSWLLNLAKVSTHLRPYGLWTPKFGIMGASPELLFEKSAGVVRSMAVAGTCPKVDTANRPHILRDAKELLEHHLVVQDLEKQLGTLGIVRKSETRVLELPTLLHLVTDLIVENSTKSTFDLMRLLHPTPALGVSPRAYGYSWMKELPDQRERGVFGAPIAYRVSATESVCLVAIRAVLWGQFGTKIGAGCGIVSGSELHREWEEVLLKANSIYQMLGL